MDLRKLLEARTGIEPSIDDITSAEFPRLTQYLGRPAPGNLKFQPFFSILTAF